MTILIGVLVALAGSALLVIGLGFWVAFRLALRAFDRSLASDVAAQGREQVERAAMAIKNAFVRRLVLNHLVSTGGAFAVSVARGAIESRMRVGLYVICVGIALIVGRASAGDGCRSSGRRRRERSLSRSVRHHGILLGHGLSGFNPASSGPVTRPRPKCSTHRAISARAAWYDGAAEGLMAIAKAEAGGVADFVAVS